EAMKLDYFVRHYADDAQQKRDPKYRAQWNGQNVDGVLYPRAGTLGGCTAHNAMITVYPHNADWDNIARLTGDDSWRADTMRGYFERLENCHHRPLYRWLGLLGVNPTRHGWRGWLQTEKAIPESALGDAGLDIGDVADASARLQRFSPYIRRAFPETADNGGIIESPLLPAAAFQQALERRYGMELPGRL
ncbi:hypothetical protein C3F00_038845, partial [Pseudomonas sp. MWU13-2860]